jgi:hypothetical protein
VGTSSTIYASQLRREITARNRVYARGFPHVESHGSDPVIVYAPENEIHGNFFAPAHASILARSGWLRRFDKVHAQARRSLPKSDRRWRELDSSMSSDALLMNIFCTPGVVDSPQLASALGIDSGLAPEFGWKARVPLRNGRFDRTEVDMRLGPLLVEAKLTESDFQTCLPAVAESYRDFAEVFDPDLLPRIDLVIARRKDEIEFPENYSQEYEQPILDDPFTVRERKVFVETTPAFASYQLIRNVLAAHADKSSFCVLLDHRRPDLREAWFEVMSAVRNADLRVRLKTITWQELAAFLPDDLCRFLDTKYGIVAPGMEPSTQMTFDEFI